MPRPAPTLPLWRRLTIAGAPYLAGIVGQRLVLEPGAELRLVRIGRDDGDGPTHALQVLPAPPGGRRLTRSELRDAVRLDGMAVRTALADSSPDPGSPW